MLYECDILPCFRNILELWDVVKQFFPANFGHSEQNILMIDRTQMVTNPLETTYQQLDVTSEAFMSLTFLAIIYRKFLHFAEKDKHEHLM